MKIFDYFRLLWRLIIFGLLIYFFNADNNMAFHFSWNFFTIWLIISLLCQPFLLNLKGLFSDVSFKKAPLKNGTHHPSVLQASYDTATQDDAIEFAGSFVLSIMTVLLGPLVLLVSMILKRFKQNKR